MRVALAIPVHGETKAVFTASLAAMLCWSLTRRVTYNDRIVTPQIETLMVRGCSRIERARETLAENALSLNVDYILWLDADQTFPPDTLFRLMSHDLPIVGCNYRQKSETEIISTAAMVRDRKYEHIAPKSFGVEPVDVIGLGVCLTKIGVFQNLPRPWFSGGPGGEDGYFCARARERGFQPHVDHELSMHVGHVTETILTFPGRQYDTDAVLPATGTQ